MSTRSKSMRISVPIPARARAMAIFEPRPPSPHTATVADENVRCNASPCRADKALFHSFFVGIISAASHETDNFNAVAVLQHRVSILCFRDDRAVAFHGNPLGIVIRGGEIFRKRLSGTLPLFPVDFYHKAPPKKRSYRFGNFLERFVIPHRLYEASLRWHYPNQVFGRRSHLPLSPYDELPFLLLSDIVYTDAAQIASACGTAAARRRFLQRRNAHFVLLLTFGILSATMKAGTCMSEVAILDDTSQKIIDAAMALVRKNRNLQDGSRNT